MIGQVMREIKNYFPYQSEGGALVIGEHTITGAALALTYLPGQYLYLMGTAVNDGVVKVASVAGQVITVTDTLLAETAAGATLWTLRPPRDFLAVVADIETFVAAGVSAGAIKSETIDDYSVTYKDTGSGWQANFKTRLSPYRCVFNEMEALRDADIRLLQNINPLH